MPQFNLGVIIPTLNEAENLEQLLVKITQELQSREIDYTICIVDDGSTDQTISIIKKLSTKNDRFHLIQRIKTRAGCQRGGASRAALEWLVKNTNHDLFTEIDADGAHRPEELIAGIKYHFLLDFDIIIASKYVYGSQVINRPLGRRLISLCYSFLARVLINPSLRDFSNSFRFYSRSAALCLLKTKLHYTSPIYLLEALVVWIANKFKIIEIPTCYIERNSGNSKVKMIDLLKGLAGLLVISLRYRSGYYKENRK